MKKTYKIEVDCPVCALKMEEAAKRTPGVRDAIVNYMTQKLTVEFEPDADVDITMNTVYHNCRRVEDDCVIYL